MKNQKTTMEIPNVLLVQNPYNGKHVNILPLMELFNCESWIVADDGPQNVAKMIEFALDYLGVHADPEDELETFKTSNFYLIKIRRCFDAMKEIKV